MARRSPVSTTTSPAWRRSPSRDEAAPPRRQALRPRGHVGALACLVRRFLLGVLALILVVGAVVFAALARGSYDRYPRAALKRVDAPAWTAPCRASNPPI